MAGQRDNFKSAQIDVLAARVAYRCSNPDCRIATVGPSSDPNKRVLTGEAAHITAAAGQGPRYDGSLSAEERSGLQNAIWLCRNCHRLIDADPAKFYERLLRDWKASAEGAAIREVQTHAFVIPNAGKARIEGIDGKPIAAAERGGDDLEARIIAAATADVAKFKGVKSWPALPVALGLEAKDKSGPYRIESLPNTIFVARKLGIVAPPGTGKTVTLTMFAEETAKAIGGGVIIVPLGQWAAAQEGLFENIAKREAFHGVSAADLRRMAAGDRLLLFLDGWNELDQASRTRLRAELKGLERDHPSMRLVMSTRRQAMDLPFEGTIATIQPLTEEQQHAIAEAISGDKGTRLLEHARRTPGVRELLNIPLYLTLLLKYAPDDALPQTKDEVFALFVHGHEKSEDHQDSIEAIANGRHCEVLGALSIRMMEANKTAISDEEARPVVSEEIERLRKERQLDGAIESAAVLGQLVAHHLLLQSDGAYTFQHQQFQEWYASRFAEDVIFASGKGAFDANKALLNILNERFWEEPVLFACERLARGGDDTKAAIAKAIMEALSIDPMLAAEMIFRSTEDVWRIVEPQIVRFVDRWHSKGNIDRAVRFMVMTGRPEFSENIWPFISDPNHQVSLNALRAATRFRLGALGADPKGKLAALRNTERETILSELVMRGDLQTMEWAAAAAVADPSTDVQSGVLNALLFRRSDRLAATILATNKQELWDEVVSHQWQGAFASKPLQDRTKAEAERYFAGCNDKAKLLGLLVEEPIEIANKDGRLEALLADPELPVDDQHIRWPLTKATERMPNLVAAALVRRVESGHRLPFHSHEFLESAPENDSEALRALALSQDKTEEAGAAAMLAGPITSRALLDWTMKYRLGRSEKRSDKDVAQYFLSSGRLQLVSAKRFIEAWLEYSDGEDPSSIAELSDLLYQHGPIDRKVQPLPIEAETRRKVVARLSEWASILLKSRDATRHQMTKLAQAMGRVGAEELAEPMLSLFDENLKRWREARDKLRAGDRGQLHEVQHPEYHGYRLPFIQVGGATLVRALSEFLLDEDLGDEAAWALKGIHDICFPQRTKDNAFASSPDFSQAVARRAEIASGHNGEDCEAAKTIFSAVEAILAEKPDEKRQRLVLAIAKVALLLPHKRRPELAEALLALPVSWQSKMELMQVLAINGEVLSSGSIMLAIDDLLERAKTEKWLMDHEQSRFHAWVALFAFSDNPDAMLDAMDKFGAPYKTAWRVRAELAALGFSPAPEASEVLSELARRNPEFHAEYDWTLALLKHEDVDRFRRLLDSFDEINVGRHLGNTWQLSERLAHAAAHNPDFKAELVDRYEKAPSAPSGPVISEALAKIADTDVVLMLHRVFSKADLDRSGVLQRAVERAAVRRDQVGETNSFELVPVAVPELRKALFDMSRGGDKAAQLAIRCLIQVDHLRDEYGPAEFEPRHPNLESQLPWPPEAVDRIN